MAGTTDPEAYNHTGDTWNNINHWQYNAAVKELLSKYRDKFANGAKLTAAQARESRVDLDGKSRRCRVPQGEQDTIQHR